MDPEPSGPPKPPTPQPEVTPHDHGGASDASPTLTRRRNGFVAQLPEAVREQINLLILDGLPYGQIPIRIGEPTKHINAEHIGEWARGGYKDWLRERDRKQDLRFAHESASGILSENAGPALQDSSRTIAAAQLHELLQAFDPRSFAATLADKPELYLRLVNTISRLSEAETVCSHNRLRESLLTSKFAAKKGTNTKEVVTEDKLKDILHQITLV